MIAELLLAVITCGSERRHVKDLTDAAAANVNLVPIDVVVGALTNLPPHCSHSNTAPRGVAEQEFKTFRVEGTVTLIRPQADHDVHIVLRDGEDTMVVESVNPLCAPGSRVFNRLKSVRKQLQRIRVGKKVSVIGVGFYDRFHNQIGMAPSCLELHPILSIQVK